MFNPAEAIIIDRYKNPRHQGNLAAPDLSLDGANPSCGDEIHLELYLEGDIVKEMTHQTRACAVCSAATDLLADICQGQTSESLRQMNAESMQKLLGISLSPVRLKCALLPLETLKRGLKID